jgi:hypothetical protein
MLIIAGRKGMLSPWDMARSDRDINDVPPGERLTGPRNPASTTTVRRIFLVCLGAAFALAFTELGLRAAGSLYLEIPRLMARNEEPGNHLIITLGESTTAFWDSAELTTDTSWPAQLFRDMRKHGYRDFTIRNLALPGCDTYTQLERLEAALAKRRPDLVIAMLGVNDWGEFESYQADTGWRSLRLVKAAHWLGERLKKTGKPTYNSEFVQLEGDVQEKSRFLLRLKGAASRRELSSRLRRLPSRWLNDRHLRYVLLAEIHLKIMRLCGVRESCRDLDEAIYSASRKSISENDSSIRMFYFLRDSGLALGKDEEMAWMFRARIEAGQGMIGASADVIERLLERRPELRPLISLQGLNGRYGRTRDNIQAVVSVLKARRVPLVLMQYPTVPLAALTHLLDSSGTAEFTSYPASFKYFKPGPEHAQVEGATLVSNEFFSNEVRISGYDAIFRDQFAFPFGSPFGHLTPYGNALLAENLLKELDAQGRIQAFH